MEEEKDKKRNQTRRRIRILLNEKYRQLWGKRWIVISILVMSLAGCIFAGLRITDQQVSYRKAREEYALLRQYLPAGRADGSRFQPKQTVPPVSPDRSDPDSDLPTASPNLPALNPDYIGWIRIAGTAVDYPVVRGPDNDIYMTTTFSGETNSAGTIFMDYQCREGFEAPAAILYGHNMRDGSMFAALKNYLDDDYLTEHPEINIINTGEDSLVYHVFDARVTDVNDMAYRLPDGGAEALMQYEAAYELPAAAGRNILLLSTCTDSRAEEERLIVLAVREE